MIIRAELGGKNQGPACRASIDLSKGCGNNCLGCYGKVVTRNNGGRSWGRVVERELKPHTLETSILRCKSQVQWFRCGKNCDPFYNPELLVKVLEICNKSEANLVIVTKSLIFREDIAWLLRDRHILHVSLGMITEAPSNAERISRGFEYRRYGVRTGFRIIANPMETMSEDYIDLPAKLLTPLRLPSRKMFEPYGITEGYKYDKNYWYPTRIHESWLRDDTFLCGHLYGMVNHCSGCLTTYAKPLSKLSHLAEYVQ